MATEELLREIMDPANRADPYPLWAELRRTRVARQDTGAYMVGGYHDVLALLHDPRVSSDRRHRTGAADAVSDGEAQFPGAANPPFIRLDPPEHDRLRRMLTRPFGPPHSPDRVDSMRAELHAIVVSLVDELVDRDRVDLVDDFAYPFPVTVICRLLGVPKQDEPRFHVWADALVAAIDPTGQTTAEQAQLEMARYMAGLIAERRESPRDDMLTGLVADEGPDGTLTLPELIVNAILLFIAGHETTVNLITNGMLTLFRDPELLERLRRSPELMPMAVEELLRFEPPVQMIPNRTPLADIEIDGVTIPAGSQLILGLASGNRDPRRFDDPDRFVPDRPDIRHLGLGSGVHSCFGAPLARLEGQMALTEIIRRLPNPRLAQDPPPYRPNPVLRGPRHLLVDCG
ncbi:cytochrome P450 [Nocardia bovistercoris]|uniref:Cytochrome P450 n=1 Tax=Nocardia bovistercoris TaxID=2785916 RepID=A0A931IGW8_9NOCA|nr:cytochrome P450 [Nocardia bovistercoris]MBH0781136.1 cytochrome P450 [Nocardia bovistercoris]